VCDISSIKESPGSLPILYLVHVAELHQTCFSVVSKEVGFGPYFRETDVTYYYFPEKVYLRYAVQCT
jgi:hypothetical protein